jgi:NAD(P)-dependent dehydrogenase (short-subunit alcohol dehydrogenase family)
LGTFLGRPIAVLRHRRRVGSHGGANPRESADELATGRFTTPEEVATLITMLASDRTANVTGANYIIDGGLIKTT